MIPALWWAIRDDDLKLLQCVCNAVMAAAWANFFLDRALVAPLTGIAVAIFQTSISALRKGVRVNPIQVRILAALKTRQGTDARGVGADSGRGGRWRRTSVDARRSPGRTRRTHEDARR